MRIIYECSHCGEQFDNKAACVLHEGLHLGSIDSFKHLVINGLNEDICKHCDHVYYVYGCERTCDFKNCNRLNNYKDFKRSELL